MLTASDQRTKTDLLKRITFSLYGLVFALILILLLSTVVFFASDKPEICLIFIAPFALISDRIFSNVQQYKNVIKIGT